MRFNKGSRKIRVKKKKKTARSAASFWRYIALAGVLLGVFYYLLYSAHEKSLQRVRQEKIQEDFDRICSAATLYAQECGALPTTEQGIAVLLRHDPDPSSPGNASDCAGTLETLPLDPWRNPYAFKGAESADEIVLFCWGADGMRGGTGEAADVIRKGCRSAPLPLR